jgi:hypothetical protein
MCATRPVRYPASLALSLGDSWRDGLRLRLITWGRRQRKTPGSRACARRISTIDVEPRLICSEIRADMT